MLRTEHKIGIVVGLVVLVGSVIFFMQQGGQTGADVADVLPMDAPAERVTPDRGEGSKPLVGSRTNGDVDTRRLRQPSRTTLRDRAAQSDTGEKPSVQTPAAGSKTAGKRPTRAKKK